MLLIISSRSFSYFSLVYCLFNMQYFFFFRPTQPKQYSHSMHRQMYSEYRDDDRRLYFKAKALAHELQLPKSSPSQHPVMLMLDLPFIPRIKLEQSSESLTVLQLWQFLTSVRKLPVELYALRLKFS